MNTKHILIVEDEVILYEKLAAVLTKHGYSVDEYTPSVLEAYDRIIEREPDLVLLDIQLKGKKNGIDLGKKLSAKFKIPFLFLTDIDDSSTFTKAISSKPELYLVKTKPFIDEEELLRHILLILSKTEQEVQEKILQKSGIFLFTDYGVSLSAQNLDPNYRELVQFEDILIIEVDLHKNKFTKQSKGSKNYVRVTTKLGKIYFYNNSLANILLKLPDTFIRISRSVAINFVLDNIKGKTSNTSITMSNNETFYIGSVYRENYEKRMKELFSL